MQRFLRAMTVTTVAVAVGVPAVGQRGTPATRAMAAADYARAEPFMSWNTTAKLGPAKP